MMMTVLMIYGSLFLIALLVTSLSIVIQDNSLREVLIISMLNVFYLIGFVFYRLLKKLAIKRGTSILGHRPVTLKDFSDLGINRKPSTSVYSFKNLFRLATMKKPKK